MGPIDALLSSIVLAIFSERENIFHETIRTSKFLRAYQRMLHWPFALRVVQTGNLGTCSTNAVARVAGHNVDSKNVDSHNVEVIMSKSQNVDNGNGESRNVESVTHTRFTTPSPIGVRNICHTCYLSDVFSLLYLCFNFIA